MSNIYIQEPPSNGKVLVKTTVGDIDIELWSKEAPKACRNFVQLCLEGYYDGTSFHRVVKDFIVQGGDPTDTGEGGESVYGAPFKDEFHTRLRFVRRGLVAMANAGPHDNGSQFFFTMGTTPELMNKHTIFGKVVGDTLYNMLKLQEVEVDEASERPTDPHKIISTEVLNNPFEDIVPRQLKRPKNKDEEKKVKSKSKATKNFSLLSFGDEAEDDEEQVDKATESFRGKSKSSHDLTDDPRLSSVPAVDKDRAAAAEAEKLKNLAEGSPDGKARKREGEEKNTDGEEEETAEKVESQKDETVKKKSNSPEDSKKQKLDSPEETKKPKMETKPEVKRKSRFEPLESEKKKSPEPVKTSSTPEDSDAKKRKPEAESDSKKNVKEEVREEGRKKKQEPEPSQDSKKRKSDDPHKDEGKKRSKEAEDEEKKKRRGEGKEEEGRKKRKGEEVKEDGKKKVKTEAVNSPKPTEKDKNPKDDTRQKVKKEKEVESPRGKETKSLLGFVEEDKQNRMDDIKKEQRKLQRDIKDSKKRVTTEDKPKVKVEDEDEADEKKDPDTEVLRSPDTASTMEITDANLGTLAGYLEKTMAPEPEVRKPAEKFLESVEQNQNYGLLLLHLMDKADVALHIRVSGAIAFKNYVKRNWRVMEGEALKIHSADRAAIKQHIVGLMLKSPEQVQNQLSDAISIIGRDDFPSRWPDLITEMVSKFQTGDFHVINGVLRTAHSIFKRYRHEFKSQELWEEIKFVLDNFAVHFTELFKASMELATKHANEPAALRVIFSSILLITKIFYSLNFQDLPEHFEDNIKTWMDNFLQLLSVDNKLLKTEDEEEAGLLEQVKSQVCDDVALYAQKYDEEFAPYLPPFVTAIWGLLVSTGQQVKYDLLVSNAIQFLASVAERPAYRSLFEDPATLANICEKVIVPNIQLRAADEELFEDNPEEYIRRDIEGSDVDTRRRAACDLVQALSKSFEGPVIQNFSTYIQGLLQEFAKDPERNWKSKDSALYLVTSLASKGMTQKQGVTQTSELVNIVDFYQGQVLPDLQSTEINKLPILKADAIKYLMVFRSQLPREALVSSLPHLMRYLTADSYVVHTYAAHSIERLFMVRTANVAAFAMEDVKPYAADLLGNMFGAMNREVSAENEYIMKAVMRTMSLLQENILPMIPQLLQGLTQKLMMVSKNPSKPHFNHYLFESMCVAIRTATKHNPESVKAFEEALFAPFTDILQQDVQEFIPYVFQILSLLMEVHGDGVPDTYMALFPHLLAPVLWERPGNIPPLVRLIQGFISQGANQIEAEKLNGLLGVFQKLLASKTHDHEGFYILNAIIEFMPQPLVQQYSKQIFILLFQRLQSSKTTKYIKSLLIFFSLFAIKFGAPSLIEMIDGIQPKMFGMVLEKLFVADLQKVSGHTERKICAVGVTKILTEAPIMLQDYEALWPRLLQALIGLFELPEDDSVPDDEHFIEIEDTPGYQTAYSQLAFAGKKHRDPLGSDVPDPKLNLAKYLGKLSSGHPGKLPVLINTGLEEAPRNYLQHYIQAANVTIA